MVHPNKLLINVKLVFDCLNKRHDDRRKEVGKLFFSLFYSSAENTPCATRKTGKVT
eukprot:XP_001708875.1 Hypothetical protein GL50803_28748 [Giardia lamblia ATCC 50803]